MPQELRVRGITVIDKANEFLRQGYIGDFNARFSVPAAEKGSAFVKLRRKDLDWIFSAQHERTVKNNNTTEFERRVLQLNKTRWKNTLAGQTVVVHEHLDGRVSVRYGPHLLAQHGPEQLPPQAPKRRGSPRVPVAKAAA